ncbi:MAG: gamma-glutamyltransferase [Actinomycetota bacterium]
MGGRGVIAAGHELTAGAGARVLRAGGNAVDAAIAAVAMACVCEPVLCSPGGGGFAMVRDGAGGSVHLIDAFAHSPRYRATDLSDGVHEIHANFGTARQAFRIGAATAAAPGLFAGLGVLAERFGTEPVTGLVADAAATARDGFAVTPFQHHLSTVVAPILTATGSARSLFAPDGHLVAAGATFRNPGLADALELLAADGLAGSAVGRSVLDQQRGRGHLTADDLDGFEVIERAPLRIEVDDAVVHLNPLPAVGGAMVAHTLGRVGSTSPLDLAATIAATGRARRPGGDLSELAPLPVSRRGTTHVSVVDGRGNACAITVSNGEGNGEVVDGFGFMLNNALGEDDVNPDGDDWPLDTRLSSMMCPAVIEHPDGSVTALGSGGSSRIRSAIAQVVARLCLDRATLDEAIAAPRLHVSGDHLDVEDGPGVDELREAFAEHVVWPEPDLFFGGVHAARRRADGSLAGVGDARRAGAAIVVGD